MRGSYLFQLSLIKFLNSDKEIFRILPPAKTLNDNRWAYYNQTVGSYSPIKMYTIEELIQNNLFSGWEKSFPINWNVLQLLNVKYVILQQKTEHEYLTLVHHNPNQS